nr:unnamed protein product [Naegleria fowleri]
MQYCNQRRRLFARQRRSSTTINNRITFFFFLFSCLLFHSCVTWTTATTTSTHKEHFRKIHFGSYQCNRYSLIPKLHLVPNLNDKSYYTPPDTLMASCKFENLCLTQSGEFVLFQSNDRILHRVDINELNSSKPWVFVQGSTIDSNRGNFHIRNVNGDLVLIDRSQKRHTKAFVRTIHKKENSCNSDDDWNDPVCLSQVEEEIKYVPIELSPNFTYYEKPVYALQRYAAGNVGHLFSESFAMIMGLMMNFKPSEIETLNDHYILFLDDLYDLKGENWRGAYQYDSRQAERVSLLTMSLLSNQSVLQLCRRDGIWRIENAPCRILKESEKDPISHQEEISSMTLDSCFSNIYMGYTVSNLILFPYGKEALFMKIRELVYRNLRIFPYDQEFNTMNSHQKKKRQFRNYLLEKDITVVIHKKDVKARHGQALVNADQLKDYLQKELPKHPSVQQLIHSSRIYSKNNKQQRKLRIETIDLSSFPNIVDQIHYFSNVDVYITDQGSAAYYSIFFREDTTVFVSPQCKRLKREIQCYTSHGWMVLSSLPNVQMLDIMELNNGQAQCKFQPAPHLYENCNFKLPLKLMFHQVVKALLKRYRNL